MQNFQKNLAKLEAADTQVLGVSMDSSFSNAAWAEKEGFNFPILSDWGGEVTKQIGIYKVTSNFAMSGAWHFTLSWDGPRGQGHTTFNSNVR